MKKNHFHSSGNSKRAAALKYGYKSGLEHTVAEQIKAADYPLNYETETLNYVVPERKAKYTPDFIFTKRNGQLIYIETKGRWTSIDRAKMKHVLASNPGIDIRMVFQTPTQKISKGSKTSSNSKARTPETPRTAPAHHAKAHKRTCTRPATSPRCLGRCSPSS